MGLNISNKEILIKTPSLQCLLVSLLTFSLILILNTVASSATISITSPAAGAIWEKGTNYTINWTSSGVTGNVKIHLYKGGAFLLPVSNNEVNDGSYSPFNAGSTIADGTDYQIRMVDVNTGTISATTGYFTIRTTPTLSITSPATGAIWEKGTNYTINWTSSGVTGNVKIHLYKGGVFLLPVSNNEVNDGSYSPFNVGSTIADGTDYQIRMVDVNTGTISATTGYFTIRTTPTLSITSPAAGAIWEKGTNYTINWTSSGVTGNVKIHLYKGGVFLLPVSNNEVNDGSYSPFNAGSTIADGTDYQIRMVDVNTGTISATTGYFTIRLSSSTQLTPLYRLYKSSIKDHFYTTSAVERDMAVSSMGFVYERSEGFISATSFTGSLPLYRLYQPEDEIHFYTTSSTEKDAKVAEGFIFEKIEGYLYPTQAEWTSPLYHAEHLSNTDHFYTTSKDEFQNAIDTWKFSARPNIGYIVTNLADNRPQGTFAGVAMAVGNLSLPSFTDISLNGVGPQLSFTRYYDSYSPGTSLGQGWSFNYDSFIQEDADGIHVTWGDGSESHFNNDLTPYPGYFEKIVKVDDGMNYGYSITIKDQITYEFRRFTLTVPGPDILLISVADRHSNKICLSRNAAYPLVQKAYDNAGRYFTFEYTPWPLADGRTVQRLTKLTDSSLTPNRFVSFSYNPQGNLAAVTDARGETTTYGYNNDRLLNTITYPEGNSVTVIYNVLQQVTGYTADNISLSFEFNPTTGTTVKNGATTLVNFVHDPQYRAEKVTFAGDGSDNVQPIYCLDNKLNLTCSAKDRNGNVFTYTYDANGNLLTTKNELLQTITTYTYDGKNNQTSVTDPKGNTTSYTYDALGKNLLSVRTPSGATTQYIYYANGQVNTITDPSSHSVTYSYDGNGNVTKISDNALGTSIDFTNDGAGRRLTQSDQFRPTPQMTTWSYDNSDNVISMQVANHPAVSFSYDGNNRLSSVVDQNGKATNYTYNAINLLSSQTSPDQKTWTYSYNSIGNLKGITLPDGNGIIYTYDTNQRLQYVRYNGQEKLFYAYDNNGNIVTMRADNSRTTSFAYDAANRVTSITDPFSNAIGYRYDLAGNRTGIIYPGNKEVVYGYDADNRLTTVKDWLGSASTAYGYNSAGILQTITNVNGTKTTFVYDSANRLTSLVNKKSDNTLLASYLLTLDNVGNPTNIDRNEPEIPPIPAVANTSYTYNSANQIENAASVIFTHDAQGNLTGSSDGRAFAFDYANRMLSANIGSDTYSYLYDGSGNRISRTKNGIQTKYILDLNGEMSNVLAETDASGTIQNYYIHGLGLISRISGAGQRSTYHYDTLGNTVVVTDDSNKVIESYAYDEFGAVLSVSPTNSTNPFRYVGQFGVMDEGNGSLYMRARYYDNENGRFMSRDPMGFEGGDLNLYAYAMNRPLVNVDPSGQIVKEAVYLLSKLGLELLQGKSFFYNYRTHRIYTFFRDSRGRFVKGSVKTIEVVDAAKDAVASWIINKGVGFVFGKGEDAPLPIDIAAGIFGPAGSALFGNAKTQSRSDSNDCDYQSIDPDLYPGKYKSMLTECFNLRGSNGPKH